MGVGVNRLGTHSDVPLISGPIERTEPVELDAARFLRANTDRATKVTVPGPFTLSQLAQNDHYPDQRSLAGRDRLHFQRQIGDVLDCDIDGVFGASEAGFEAHESGLHEKYEC